MVQDPDPTTPVTTIKGRTRSLDDWLTSFELCLVALPSWLEAAAYVPLGERALRIFQEADCKAAFLVVGNERQARRILGDVVDQYVVFLDPDRTVVTALGLNRLPAFLHVRADATVAASAEGWDPAAWNRVADSLAKTMRWSRPVYPLPGDPRPSEGWPL